MQKAVEFKNITKKYGNIVAVDDISFSVGQGELVTLLGPSGCGKTTTLRMVAGLELPTHGDIIIDGQTVTNLTATDRNVSMVFQSYALFPHMNVIENVSYGLIIGKQNKQDAYAKAEEALNTVGLSGYGQRLPSELSGGQQQRVAVARALVLKPAVLLFDEPLSNLDAKLRRHMREEIRALQQKLNLTVLYVTHDQEEAMAVSDEIIVMNNAVIADKDTPQKLYKNPVQKFVATFIGESSTVKAKTRQIENGKYEITIGTITKHIASDILLNDTVEVVIRPECIKLHKTKLENTIEATVQVLTYLGSHYELELLTPMGVLFTKLHDQNFSLEQNETVYIQLQDNGFHVM